MRAPPSLKRPLRRLAESITHWRPRRMHELAHDTDAAIAPMVAVLGMSLILAAGLALDVTLYIAGNRDLRSATEAAALAAAIDPNQAESRARDYLTHNGYGTEVQLTVQTGRYCADKVLASGERFIAGDGTCPNKSGVTNPATNAVRVRTSAPSRRFLTAGLGGNVIPDLAATATAARIDEAGVGVTSGVLDINTPLVTNIVDALEVPVNTILGALLNTAPLDLQSHDVEALMRHDVDAGLFFDNLAARQNFTGTYSGLLANGPVPLSDVLYAAADATGDQASAAALRKIATSPGARAARIDLDGMFGLGVWEDMPVGEADAHSVLRAGMNAYQLLTFAAQRVGGKIDLSSLTNTITGTSSTVRVGAVVLDSHAQPNFSFGPAGETHVATAKARLEVKVGLPDITLLGQKVTVNVPLILEIAPATASVSDISCPGRFGLGSAEQAQDTRVQVNASTGIVGAFIGKVSPAIMERPFNQPISANDIQQEAITGLEVNLLLTKITAGIEGKAASPNFLQTASEERIFIGNDSNDPKVGRIGRPGADGMPEVVGTSGEPITNRSQIGNSVSALLNNLNLSIEASLLGINLGINLTLLKSQLVQAITTPLTNILGGIADPLLDTVLGALGIQLGHASVWVTGARCGVPVLV